MLALRADIHDLLAFEMLSRHTLDMLRHKHAVSEGDLFSALMQVLREQRRGAAPARPRAGHPLCGPEEHICRHCGEILAKKDAMKHLWQAHDLVVRHAPEAHYSTDPRLAALYQEARAAGTDPAAVVAAWEATVRFEQLSAAGRTGSSRRYLVRRRGYTILVLGSAGLNAHYQRQDLNRDSQRRGFARCLKGTFILVPMRT